MYDDVYLWYMCCDLGFIEFDKTVIQNGASSDHTAD